MDNYYDIFSSWEDVQREYQMEESLPDEVLYAYYSYEDYDGTSVVIYRNGDKFYWVNGGHCSCYGLGGQWDPEEYDAETLVAAWNRANYRDVPDFVLQRVKEFLPLNYNGA